MAKKKAVVSVRECVACGCCMKVCPRNAISIPRGLYAEINSGLCVGCGKCSEICPQGIDVPKEMEQFSEALKKIPSWAEICRQRDAAQARR